VFVDNAVGIPQLAGAIISVTQPMDPPGPAPFNEYAAEGTYANLPAAFQDRRFNDAGTATVDWNTGDFIDDAGMLGTRGCWVPGRGIGGLALRSRR